MIRLLSVTVERWPVAGAFTISRGAKTHVDVVVVELGHGPHRGRGEATPIYYHGETAQGCVDALNAYIAGGGGLDRASVRASMSRGAARNALDAALWDLESAVSGVPVWALAQLDEPGPVLTAFTISLGDPARMEHDARAAWSRGFRLLKCKLTGEGDIARVAAVRQGAPDARLIVDANESWTGRDLVAEADAMAALGVELIEQPVSRDADHLLANRSGPVPFCADESCQDSADLPRLGAYAAINIKLDKAGGLSEAIRMASLAREGGQKVMIGCMLATSLGIAPAFLLAGKAQWVDLDGALLLERDRDGGLCVRDGMLHPGTLWG